MHQRQKKILDMLQKGKLLIPETADILGVSQMTLRRDLRELEKRKLLLQVKNGAIPHPARYEPEPAAEDELMQCKFALANLPRIPDSKRHFCPQDSLFCLERGERRRWRREKRLFLRRP